MGARTAQTAAACASYFLIVADFSRSSVFSLAQMNSSGVGQTGAVALATPSLSSPPPQPPQPR